MHDTIFFKDSTPVAVVELSFLMTLWIYLDSIILSKLGSSLYTSETETFCRQFACAIACILTVDEIHVDCSGEPSGRRHHHHHQRKLEFSQVIHISGFFMQMLSIHCGFK
jgi:hypothetical protein